MASKKRHPIEEGDKPWYLVARFNIKGDDEKVFFVKIREVERGQILSCTCDGYAANLINGVYDCRHTDYTKKFVIDEHGSILIDKLPPKKLSSNKKLANLWLDRNVRTIITEE